MVLARSMWKNLWSANVPSKVRVFAWKAVRNGLPTRANKHRRHLAERPDFELCGHDREDVFHAIISCPHAQALRQAMRDQWALPKEEELVWTGPDWLLLLLDRYDGQTRMNFLMLLWRCWSVRNSVLQAGECISIKGSVCFLSRYLFSLQQVRPPPPGDNRGKQPMGAPVAHPTTAAKTSKKWSAPIGEILKINVDDAFILETGEAAVGVVIRDKEGQPMLMACRKLSHCRDAEEAEALACLEGIRMGTRWPERDFIMEADNALVIEKLRTGGMHRSVVAPIIRDTLQAKVQLRSVEFTKIGREQNKLAHELAHLAVRNGVCRVWFANFPGSLITLACNDTI